MAGVRGQVDDLVVGAEDDLDLLDRAAVAVEAVVDPAADDPAAELGERPAQVGPLADDRVAVLEDGDAGRQVLDAGDREAGVGGEVDLERAGEQALGDGLALGARRSADRTRRAPPRGRPRRPSPRWTIVRVTRARSGTPAAQRTMTGCDEADAVGHDEPDALAPEAPGQLGELVVGRQRSRRPRGRRAGRRDRGRAPRRTSRASPRRRSPRPRARRARRHPRAGQ